MKRFSPVIYENVEAETVLKVAGSKNRALSESEEIPPGSIERGEHTKDYKRTWEVCAFLLIAVKPSEVL